MAKTLSFAGVHFIVAFSVGYLLSGSLAIGGAIALVEPMCNTVAYFFHEKFWDRRRQRQEKKARRRVAGSGARSDQRKLDGFLTA